MIDDDTMALRAAESEPAVPPTKSAADEMSEKAKEQLTKIAKEMGMPVWALYCIGIGKLIQQLDVVSRRFFFFFFLGRYFWPAGKYLNRKFVKQQTKF